MAKKRIWSKQRHGYKSYGSTALGKGFQVAGVEDFLKKIQDIGGSVEDAVKQAIDESVKPIVEDMIAGAERHRDQGDVVNAIEAHPAIQDGNYIYSRVGIDLNKHPEAAHAVFQEYGDGHSDVFPDPFVSPAFDNNKSKVKSVQKNVLYRLGIL
jgi:hypothetical protein